MVYQCTNSILSLHIFNLSLHILCVTAHYFMPWLAHSCYQTERRAADFILGDRLRRQLSCDEARSCDRRGLLSIATDDAATSSRVTPAAGGCGTALLKGILKKTPASLNSVRLGENAPCCALKYSRLYRVAPETGNYVPFPQGVFFPLKLFWHPNTVCHWRC